MRITHFVENLERGGLERVVIDLALAQQAAGHDCRVICLFEQGALAPELEARGIQVHACGKRRGQPLQALLRARRLLRQWPDGIVHSHNAVAHYHVVAAAAGLGLRAIVNTRHGMGAADPRSRREWLYRRAVRHSDAVVAVCEAARAKLAGQGVRPRRPLLVVPNGIRVERFEASTAFTRLQLADELGLSPSTRIIGTVGRLNPVKDQAGMIRAFAMVHGRHADTALVLVGDGALRAELEAVAVQEGVRGAVHFMGDRSDVRRLLRGFDLFVLSSLTEGYSMALLEACASALPVVATDVGGNADIVRDGVNGRLVPPADPHALAAAVCDLLQCPPSALAQLGGTGRDWALTEASLDTMAGRYASVYVASAGGRIAVA